MATSPRDCVDSVLAYRSQMAQKLRRNLTDTSLRSAVAAKCSLPCADDFSQLSPIRSASSRCSSPSRLSTPVRRRSPGLEASSEEMGGGMQRLEKSPLSIARLNRYKNGGDHVPQAMSSSSSRPRRKYSYLPINSKPIPLRGGGGGRRAGGMINGNANNSPSSQQTSPRKKMHHHASTGISTGDESSACCPPNVGARETAAPITLLPPPSRPLPSNHQGGVVPSMSLPMSPSPSPPPPPPPTPVPAAGLIGDTASIGGHSACSTNGWRAGRMLHHSQSVSKDLQLGRGELEAGDGCSWPRKSSASTAEPLTPVSDAAVELPAETVMVRGQLEAAERSHRSDSAAFGGGTKENGQRFGYTTAADPAGRGGAMRAASLGSLPVMGGLLNMSGSPHTASYPSCASPVSDLDYENYWLRQAVEKAKLRNSEIAARQEAVKARIRLLEEENRLAGAKLMPQRWAASAPGSMVGLFDDDASTPPARPRSKERQEVTTPTRDRGSKESPRLQQQRGRSEPALLEARDNLLKKSNEAEAFLDSMLARREHLRAAVMQGSGGARSGRRPSSRSKRAPPPAWN